MENSANRVIRGGSWNSNAQNVRAAYRNWNSPENRNNNLGFRCRTHKEPGRAPCEQMTHQSVQRGLRKYLDTANRKWPPVC
ncbi:MAG: SUMF1/EgtB/PvdO family nonheme iron enzyme [Planctomycetota bacterium]